ncbi:hypothetical protein WJX72_011686 [[Myrmecia] bisecta]|uniref:RING-type domain-containing protein n=1 Tax=[Myrmecia] bisecta TaxID=41462 RepID=A0AAW1PQG1_9CHLO
MSSISTEMQRVQVQPAQPTAAEEASTRTSDLTDAVATPDTTPAATAADASATGNRTGIILGPARVKVDSRVALCQFTINWLANAVLAMFVLLKANNTVHGSWWLTFLPAWIGHSVHLPFQLVCLLYTDRLVTKQLGTPPADPMLQIHYEAVKGVRLRAHIVDTANSAIEGVFHCIAKALFCFALTETWGHQLHGDFSAFKIVFLPLCASWVTTTLLGLYKDKAERVCGSVRDMQFVLMLFVAFKLDGRSNYPWRVVFLILWVWFCVLFLLTTVVLVVIMSLRARGARWRDMLLPIGILALLLSAAPQFMSYYYLASRLDGDPSISYTAILLPNAISWFAMWLSGIVIAAGLRRKEQVRAALLASGALWANPDDLMMRQLQQAAMQNVQQKVDAMTEEEVAVLVDTLMQGKAKPLQLLRVGQSLFRRITEAAEAQLSESHPGSAATAESKVSLLSGDASNSKDTVIDILPGAVVQQQQPKHGPLVDVAESSSIASASHMGGQHPHHHTSDEESGLIPALYNRSSQDAESPTEAVALRAGPSHSLRPSTAPTCVFLECGHGGICRSCGNRLFARPPHECPTCRQKIAQIVQLEQLGSIGDVVAVKQ